MMDKYSFWLNAIDTGGIAGTSFYLLYYHWLLCHASAQPCVSYRTEARRKTRSSTTANPQQPPMFPDWITSNSDWSADRRAFPFRRDMPFFERLLVRDAHRSHKSVAIKLRHVPQQHRCPVVVDTCCRSARMPNVRPPLVIDQPCLTAEGITFVQTIRMPDTPQHVQPVLGLLRSPTSRN